MLITKKKSQNSSSKGQKIQPGKNIKGRIKSGKSGPVKKQAPKDLRSLLSNIYLYLFVFIIGVFILDGLGLIGPAPESIPFNEVLRLVNEDQVQDITVKDSDLTILLKDGTTVTSKKEAGTSIFEVLSSESIPASKVAGSINIEQKFPLESVLSLLLSIGIPLVILYIIFRSMRGASSDMFSFGRSKAKLFVKESSKITFNDVAGIDEAKSEMVEIVDFLKNPKKYSQLSARIPRGVLLVGPAGVGKTLLAKAIAGEANVPFFSVAGSEFMEMLVGVGSSRVRDLFAMAKESQPSLIFIDEIDAIGRQRGMGIGGGHDEREQTLNQILIEMDGFDPRVNVIVLAATNRPDMLDPALIRAGRFDRRISLNLPDLKDREAILKIHAAGKPLNSDVDFAKIAKKTVGFSGADLENMLNEAAILAARDSAVDITMNHIDEASLKVTMGPERRRLQDENEKRLTAYHEAGHAVVAYHAGQLDSVERVTIVPRGGSLGHTSLPPEKDRTNETQTRLLSMLQMMMGGRAAEEYIFSEISTGAASDIERATELARRMVTEFGMSDLGPVSFDGAGGKFWLAKQMGEMPHYSDSTATKIDDEIRRIIDSSYTKALSILKQNAKGLETVAQALLEKETLDGEEFRALMEKAQG